MIFQISFITVVPFVSLIPLSRFHVKKCWKSWIKPLRHHHQWTCNLGALLSLIAKKAKINWNLLSATMVYKMKHPQPWFSFLPIWRAKKEQKKSMGRPLLKEKCQKRSRRNNYQALYQCMRKLLSKWWMKLSISTLALLLCS